MIGGGLIVKFFCYQISGSDQDESLGFFEGSLCLGGVWWADWDWVWLWS